MGDDSWVFDSLVGFLRGPVWNVPILTFVEHKSLIFEPGCEDDEPHKKVHEEYKNLVDFMLGSYMEDIGITPEQFEAACGKASTNIKTQFHQTLFEQVWAADDFAIFKPMMIQKNLELQLQALELLQQKYGVIPASCTPGDDMSKDEQDVMAQVIKKSMEEHEAMKETIDQEQRDIERAIVESKAEREIIEARRTREKDILASALKLSLKDNEESSSSSQAPPLQIEEAKIDLEEMQKRQEYLKQQRDKLLAMKQQERAKQLAAYENKTKARPKSSRAAKRVLTGANIDPQTLQVRKALAERLKAEVIDQQ